MERCLVLFSKDYRYSVRKINILYLCYMNDILRLHNIVNLLMIISKYIYSEDILIRDSSDTNARFYIVMCRGEYKRGG